MKLMKMDIVQESHMNKLIQDMVVTVTMEAAVTNQVATMAATDNQMVILTVIKLPRIKTVYY